MHRTIGDSLSSTFYRVFFGLCAVAAAALYWPTPARSAEEIQPIIPEHAFLWDQAMATIGWLTLAVEGAGFDNPFVKARANIAPYASPVVDLDDLGVAGIYANNLGLVHGEVDLSKLLSIQLQAIGTTYFQYAAGVDDSLAGAQGPEGLFCVYAEAAFTARAALSHVDAKAHTTWADTLEDDHKTYCH